MKFKKNKIANSLLNKNLFKINVLIILLLSLVTNTFGQKQYDIVIYGGSSAGIASAIQASRMGKSVVLIEPSNRLGGLTTGGLGQTDIGNKQAIGGISREFYKNIRNYYNNPANWKWQTPESYSGDGQSKTDKGEETLWTFEPSAAVYVYEEMLKPEKIDIVYNHRLNRETGVVKDKQKITSIKMDNGRVFNGKMFIDATYEGDLMAAANVDYTVGRESNATYDETLNGVQANKLSFTINKKTSRNGYNHNFVDYVDPYIVKGDPKSGLLPHINPEAPGVDGEGDKKMQAYCFRMTLTDHPENRIPFQKPANYDELNYELLLRNYENIEKEVKNSSVPITYPMPWINSPMPNRKTDTNNRTGFSTDFIGQNYDYPEANYAERKKIVKAHLDYQQGLMWTLANHPRIPLEVRKEISRWGTTKDEYEKDSKGWQNQLYIREARRMKSDYVITQKDCEGLTVCIDPVGMAAYTMDSHHVQRYVDVNGFVKNEGNVEAPISTPYPISYRAIVPSQKDCTNLLVPICLSSSHIAFGSIRMEPVFMVLGQTAATAASQAIDEQCDIQSINYDKLKTTLLKDKQVLSN